MRLFKLISGVLLICFFLALFFHPITAINDDLGRHLLLGKIIFTTHSIPKTNLLSYTNTDFTFINSHWFSEVIFYLITQIFGFNGLLSFSTLIIAISIGIQFFYAFQRYHFGAVLASTTLYTIFLCLRSDIRPEIFSMLFTTIFIVFLYKFREKPSRQILFLIPVEILWVNMHIYFFVGPLLMGLFLLESLFKYKFSIKSLNNRYLTAFLGVLIATVLNPNGVNGAIFPLMVLQNYGLAVAENQSLLTLFNLYQQSGILFILFFMFSLYILLLWGKTKASIIDYTLVTIFSLFSILAFRSILLLIFATLLVFTKQIDFLFSKYFSKFKSIPKLSQYFLAAIGLLFMVVLILQAIQARGFGFGLNDLGRGAGDFLLENKIEGPVFNDFNFGGYLSYRIYPQKVFIDNRPEAYPSAFLRSVYLAAQTNPTIFEELDQKYQFNSIAIAHWDKTPWKNKLYSYLFTDPKFALVYLDPYAFVMVRRTDKNSLIIARTIDKNSINFNSIDDTQTLIQYLFLFEKIGWPDKASEAFLRLKSIDPQLCSLKRYPLLKTRSVSFVPYSYLDQQCN